MNANMITIQEHNRRIKEKEDFIAELGEEDDKRNKLLEEQVQHKYF